MILKEALLAIPRRFRRPGLLALFLITSGVMVAALFQKNPMVDQARRGLTHWGFWSQILQTILAIAFSYFGSAFFWQWTGDGRRMGRGWRGLGRATLLCGLFHGFTSLFTLSQDLAETRRFLPEMLVWPFLVMTLVASFLWMLLVSVLIATWEARRADRDEARHQMEEAKWALLKAQMSPHLLLNSLNSLVQLTREDPAAAAWGMKNLGEIYRRLVHLGDSMRIPLAEERRFLERYLAVEQLRFGERLCVEWDWDEVLDGMQIIPLLLQPLVENAVKHGVSSYAQGGIVRIQALREGRWVRFEVANTTPAVPAASKGTGMGLRNLRARLELAYGAKAKFQLAREAGWTRAQLDLPWEG